MRIFFGFVRARLGRWRLTDFVEAPAELGPVLSFSELKERSGIEDSGLFNHHLGELEGGFAEKTEAGYRLTRGGIELSAVLAEGWHDIDVERMDSALDGECLISGGSVGATYENGEFSVACESGHTLAVDSFPR